MHDSGGLTAFPRDRIPARADSYEVIIGAEPSDMAMHVFERTYEDTSDNLSQTARMCNKRTRPPGAPDWPALK